MSHEDWKLEKDLCRCCHSEGAFKSLCSPDSITKHEILYSDMMRDSFDIELSQVQGPLLDSTYTICEVCIARLQDAHSFKQQVLRCESRFQAMYSRNSIKVVPSEPTIKQELPDSDDGDLVAVEDDDSMDITYVDKEKSKKGVKRKKMVKQQRVPNKRPRDSEPGADDAFYVAGTGHKSKKPSYRLLHSDYEQIGDALKCTRCSKLYSSANGLRFHVKTQHINLPKYNCPVCDKPFKTLAPFIKHKLDEHEIDDRIKCNACDNIFNTKTQLIKHRNSFHMLGVKHKCPQCEYECFSVEAMYKHKFKHKTVKEHHCKFCRKSFLRKTTLDLHERIHTGDRRKVCAECGQAFVQKASLNYHMTKYHPEVKF